MKQLSRYNKLLDQVAGLLERAREETVRRINAVITETYWEIGRLIVEEEQKGRARAGYGEFLIARLSRDLTKRFGKGFTAANIRNMRQFYSVYPNRYAVRSESRDEKRYSVRDELTWTHYRALMRIEDPTARSFYEIEAAKNRWSSRELKRQMNSLLFERLALSKNEKKARELARRGQIVERPEDAIKDPYVLEFLDLPERSYYTESQLEQKLVDHLQEFLLELGKGFAFVARQKRITIENEHYYVDLVLYNRILRCLVLIDLKIGKLSHGDVGQMNFYLNYARDKEMMEGENLPVGIILCTDKSKVFVEYALGGLDNKIFVSKYKLYLPTKKELQREVRQQTRRLKEIGYETKGTS